MKFAFVVATKVGREASNLLPINQTLGMMNHINQGVSGVESDYATPHIYIGTTKSIEKSNITPGFIEKLAKMLSDRWEKVWNEQRLEQMEYDIQHRYGSDCYFGHLSPIPKEMKKIIKASSVSGKQVKNGK